MKVDIFNTDKKYSIIYADPPWSYNDKLGGKAKMGACPYPTMSIADIKELPVEKIADKDCVLFCWATMPKLQEALDTVKAWGFKYKTVAFVWIKTNPQMHRDLCLPLTHFVANSFKTQQEGVTVFDRVNRAIFSGIGRWVKGNAELVFLATKGNPHRIRNDIKQVVLAPRGAHSAKPEDVRSRIELLMGGGEQVQSGTVCSPICRRLGLLG